LELTRLYWVLKKNITLLDGRNLLLSREAVTQPGFVQIFKGEGMPHFGSRSTKGDLFVEYNVILPLEVSSETRLKLIEAFHSPSSTHDEL